MLEVRARQVGGERPTGEPYPRVLYPQVEIGDGKAKCVHGVKGVEGPEVRINKGQFVSVKVFGRLSVVALRLPDFIQPFLWLRR